MEYAWVCVRDNIGIGLREFGRRCLWVFVRFRNLVVFFFLGIMMGIFFRLVGS